MHHPHHHHRHQSAPRFLLATPAGASPLSLKTSDSQANRFSRQTRERLVAGWSQLPGCLPVSGDRREIGCEAERRSCINTDQRTTARLPASAITYSRGEGHSQPLADYIDHRGQNHNLIHLSPHLKISPCPGDLSVLINGPR